MPTPHVTNKDEKVGMLEPEIRDKVYLASGYMVGILENRDHNEAFNFFI